MGEQTNIILALDFIPKIKWYIKVNAKQSLFLNINYSQLLPMFALLLTLWFETTLLCCYTNILLMNPIY